MLASSVNGSPRIQTSLAGPLVLVLFVCAGCSDDEEKKDDEVESCDLDAPKCDDGLVCVAQEKGDALCQIPAGGACDPEVEESNCRLNSECLDNPEAKDDDAAPDHVCLVVEAGECDPIEPFCAPPLTCAEIEGEEVQRCFAPLLVRGHVSDSMTSAGISGAHVIALDDEGVATTDVAPSGEDGEYELAVPVVRDGDGKPINASFTLRAAAQDYQTFPGGLRTALPLNTSDAAEMDDGWVVEGTPTELVLIALAGDGSQRRVVSGRLRASEDDDEPEVLAKLSGTLIVATGPVTQSALTDRSGAFTLFNVEDGAYTLKGYAAGVDVTPLELDVAGEDEEDVELTATLRSLATVTGSIQLVNAPGGAKTSVILVVEDTFDDKFVRGDVPRGLRAPRSGAPNVTGAFTIADVPDGRYVVLAAFENDQLVRDPDTNIAGTDLVRIDVKGAEVTLGESFKVTEALAIRSPGAELPEAVTKAPVLTWADDSSEDWYDVVVYNAFGDEVWRADKVPGVSGSEDVTVSYGGPLDAGMYYQFRVTSWRAPGGKNPAPISSTEDLRGVFYVEP